jgi:hypothetical protein
MKLAMRSRMRFLFKFAYLLINKSVRLLDIVNIVCVRSQRSLQSSLAGRRLVDFKALAFLCLLESTEVI